MDVCDMFFFLCTMCEINVTLHYIGILYASEHIGADTGGMKGIDPPTFIPALLVLLFLGGLSPPAGKQFLGSLRSP
jgi:hypothetical protein